jgi:hypothetical protein
MILGGFQRMRFAKLMVFSAISLGAGAQAWANLIINPTYASNITSDGNAVAIENAIQSAINVYEADFSDPITVNIIFQEMSTGLGKSSTAFGTVSYAAYLAALTADRKTTDDFTAVANLPSAGAYQLMYGTTQINVKTANLRAIGLAGGANPDGTISLNTSITNPPNSSGSFNLTVVVEHEIDEVLGLGSALPTFTTPFPEDLYRYTSAGALSFTVNNTVKAFFSIDGTTDLAQFDNQNDGGDFGDWQSNPLPNGVQPKVQDAFSSGGSAPALGVELRALDVIGYDFVAPEPSTGLLLASALAVLAGLTRRRAIQ